jgi:hypothetical protein
MPETKTSLLAILLAATTATACGTSINHTQINPSPRPMVARPAETVEMFTSGAPQRPHVDVLFIEAEETSSMSTDRTPEMLNKLRVHAAKLGCDGIVIGGLSSRAPGVSDTESWLVDSPKARKGLWATCIVYS